MIENKCLEMYVLDEEQKWEINARLHCALHNYLTVDITYYDECELVKIIGKIEEINKNRLILKLSNQPRTEFNIENLIYVSIL